MDKDEILMTQLDTISAIHTEEVNGENVLNFECHEEVRKYDRVMYKDALNNWHEFMVQEVIDNRDTNSVYAEHSSYELRGDVIEDRFPTAGPRGHLEVLLANTRWTIGDIGSFGDLRVDYYRLDVQTAINKMVEAFGAYISYTIVVVGNAVTARKINISNTSGYELGKRFVYSKDLLNVERTVMMDDVITALYGFGKGEEIGDGHGRRISFKDLDYPDSPAGQMYITDDDARIKYGRNSPTGKKHVFHTVTFDDVEDPEEIYRLTKERLQNLNEIKINYVADVILLDEQFENVLVGDTVSIIDEDFRGRKLNLKGVIFRIERDLISPTNSKVSLGNYVEDSADTENELLEYIKNFRDKVGVWDRSNSFGPDGSLNASYIKDLLDSWNNMLNGAGGFVYAEPGEGIITYDRAIDDNPTSAVQITGGGWRIANSKKSDGEWDWRTVGTGDGIYGDQIIANTITVNKLSSDVGSNLDISSNNAINQIVAQIDETTGLLQEEISSQVQQTVDSFNVIFSKLEADQDLTNGEIELIQSYFKINENGVIIGKSNSTIQFFAENNRVGFREGDNDIAYWEEGTMNVERLIAITTIMVGYHLIEKYDSPVAGKTTIVRISD